jgi:translation initiation factor 2B subunit (eIF-2B alpha/beta/delta family)
LLPILAAAVDEGPAATLDVARLVCRGQPAMASLWRACAAAVVDHQQPGRFARARQEMERSRSALAKAGGRALTDLLDGVESPRLMTLSFSSSVVDVLASVRRPLRAVCGEGRPRFEGRRMAVALADCGVAVTLVTDAALTACLDDAAAVIVGADAVAATFWINKVGTHGLAAVAHRAGVPLFVVAGREKGMPGAIEGFWRPHAGAADEVWPEADPRVVLANPYFESVPVDLVTLFLTDAGLVPPEAAPTLAQRDADALTALLNQLG